MKDLIIEFNTINRFDVTLALELLHSSITKLNTNVVKHSYTQCLISVARIVQVRVVNCLNFFPLRFSQFATLCFHEVINHTPIGIHFVAELGQRLQSRVEQIGVVLIHEWTITHQAAEHKGVCATSPTGFYKVLILNNEGLIENRILVLCANLETVTILVYIRFFDANIDIFARF